MHNSPPSRRFAVSFAPLVLLAFAACARPPDPTRIRATVTWADERTAEVRVLMAADGHATRAAGELSLELVGLAPTAAETTARSLGCRASSPIELDDVDRQGALVWTLTLDGPCERPAPGHIAYGRVTFRTAAGTAPTALASASEGLGGDDAPPIAARAAAEREGAEVEAVRRYAPLRRRLDAIGAAVNALASASDATARCVPHGEASFGGAVVTEERLRALEDARRDGRPVPPTNAAAPERQLGIEAPALADLHAFFVGTLRSATKARAFHDLSERVGQLPPRLRILRVGSFARPRPRTEGETGRLSSSTFIAGSLEGTLFVVDLDEDGPRLVCSAPIIVRQPEMEVRLTRRENATGVFGSDLVRLIGQAIDDASPAYPPSEIE